MAGDEIRRRVPDEKPVYYVYELYRDAAMIRPFYVGKGKGRRWRVHIRPRGTNLHRNRIIESLTYTLGFVPMHKIAEGMIEADAFRLERERIAALGRYPDGPLVNATDGGEGQSNPSAETRAKMGPNKGRKFGDVFRARVSAAAKLRVGDKNSFFGRHHSEDTKTQISRMKAGKSLRSDHRELLSQLFSTPEGRELQGRKFRGRTHTVTVATREHLSEVQQGRRDEASAIAKELWVDRPLIWITNGAACRRVPPGTLFPAGWRRGRIHKRRII